MMRAMELPPSRRGSDVQRLQALWQRMCWLSRHSHGCLRVVLVRWMRGQSTRPKLTVCAASDTPLRRTHCQQHAVVLERLAGRPGRQVALSAYFGFVAVCGYSLLEGCGELQVVMEIARQANVVHSVLLSPYIACRTSPATQPHTSRTAVSFDRQPASSSACSGVHFRSLSKVHKPPSHDAQSLATLQPLVMQRPFHSTSVLVSLKLRS